MRNQISRKQTSCGLQIKFTRFLINDVVSTSTKRRFISHTKLKIYNFLMKCLLLLNKNVEMLYIEWEEDSSDTNFNISNTSLVCTRSIRERREKYFHEINAWNSSNVRKIQFHYDLSSFRFLTSFSRMKIKSFICIARWTLLCSYKWFNIRFHFGFSKLFFLF